MIRLILKFLTQKVFLKILIPLLAVYLLARFVSLWAGLGLFLLLLAYVAYRNRAGIYSWFGNMNYYKGCIDEAKAWYSKAYNCKSANPRTMVSYGYLELKMGNIDRAEEVFKSVINSNINEDDKMFARSNMALAMWKRGDLDGAIKELEEIIETYKTSVVYGTLGYLLIEKGDLEKAMAFNLEAYEYNNDNTVILDNIGNCYYLLGQYDKAKEIHEKLIAKNPAFPEAWYNYGRILRKTDGPEKALDAVKKALDYKLTFLSTITKEDIEKEIESIEEEIKNAS